MNITTSDASEGESIQTKLATAKPGDTILVKEGTYAGFIAGWDAHYPPLIGSPSQPITILAQGVVRLGRNGKTHDGIYLAQCKHVVIDGFMIRDALGSGIHATHCENLTISNCGVDSCKDWGIFTSWCNQLMISRVIASNTREQHGVYISNSAVNPTVIDSIFLDNAECGLHLNGDQTQGGTGLISGATITGNTFRGNARRGGAALNCDGVQASRIEQNFFHGNHRKAIALFRQDGGGASSGNSLTKNLVIQPRGAGPAVLLQSGAVDIFISENLLDSQTAAVIASSDSNLGLGLARNLYPSCKLVSRDNGLTSELGT